MDNNNLKFTPQAVGAIMMCLQRGLMMALNNKPAEECDVSKLILNLDLQLSSDNKIIVLNPPMLQTETE